MHDNTILYRFVDRYGFDQVMTISRLDSIMLDSLYDLAYDMLADQYDSDIESRFDFTVLNPALYSIVELQNSQYGKLWIGSVFALLPSNKYWLSWAMGNVTEAGYIIDSIFMDRLDRYAENHDGWIESGEGDPTDLYFCFDMD